MISSSGAMPVAIESFADIIVTPKNKKHPPGSSRIMAKTSAVI